MGGAMLMAVTRVMGALGLAVMGESVDSGRPPGGMMRCGDVLPAAVGVAVAGSR
jgi:hypothetical protein